VISVFDKPAAFTQYSVLASRRRR